MPFYVCLRASHKTGSSLLNLRISDVKTLKSLAICPLSAIFNVKDTEKTVPFKADDYNRF